MSIVVPLWFAVAYVVLELVSAGLSTYHLVLRRRIDRQRRQLLEDRRLLLMKAKQASDDVAAIAKRMEDRKR